MTIDLEKTPTILHVDNNICYTNNGNIVFCYKLDLTEAYSCSESKYDEIHNVWFTSLKQLPPGIIIHKQDIFLKEKYDSSMMKKDNFLQTATARYFDNRKKLNHISYIFFVIPDISILNNKSIQNPFKKKVTKDILEKDNEKKELIGSEIQKCVEFINSSRILQIDKMNKEEISYLNFAYFNGFYDDRITECEFNPKKKEEKIGDKIIGVFSISNIKQFEVNSITNCLRNDEMSSDEYTYYKGYSEGLTFNIDCDHIYNQIIYTKDHHRELKRIEKNHIDLKGARKFSKENEVNADKLGKSLDEIYSEGNVKLCFGHNNIIFFASDKKEYSRIEENISTEFKKMDIIPYYPIGNQKKNIFYNSNFTNTAYLDSSSKFGAVDMRHLICLFNNITNYKSDERGIILNDRIFNTPLKVDIWDEEKKYIKARNFFIMAPTGEGKSVLAQHIFRQYYEEGITLVIVDLGGSYRKLSALYDNTAYIRYVEGQSLNINPFELLGKELNTNKLEILTTFVFKHYKYDRLPNEEEAVSLRKIIRTYYNTEEINHSFPNFVRFVDKYRNELLPQLEIKDEFFNIDEFLHNCKEYIDGGTYSFLYDSEDKIEDLSNKRMIVFELDELKDNEKLLTIMLHLISDTIQTNIWKDKSSKGVIFFDEFAKMLKFPSVLSSVEYYTQAIRKQEGGIGVALQTPNQLPETPGAKSIIENTQIIYVINNDKGYKPVVERFNLTDHEENQLKSMRNKFSGQIQYSEFMLKRGKHSNIYRLELPPEVYFAYQTDGKEYEEIMSLYEKGFSMEDAINQYQQKKLMIHEKI